MAYSPKTRSVVTRRLSDLGAQARTTARPAVAIRPRRLQGLGCDGCSGSCACKSGGMGATTRRAPLAIRTRRLNGLGALGFDWGGLFNNFFQSPIAAGIGQNLATRNMPGFPGQYGGGAQYYTPNGFPQSSIYGGVASPYGTGGGFLNTSISPTTLMMVGVGGLALMMVMMRR